MRLFFKFFASARLALRAKPIFSLAFVVFSVFLIAGNVRAVEYKIPPSGATAEKATKNVAVKNIATKTGKPDTPPVANAKPARGPEKTAKTASTERQNNAKKGVEKAAGSNAKTKKAAAKAKSKSVSPVKKAKKAAKTKSRLPKKRIAYKRSGICKDLDKLARKYNLPPLFFARLIWQESGFNPYAVSPVGAEGIAQFMPETARIWGLEDPFEPGEALIRSAQYLSWLRRKLGNLGLAAAGYNAGSGRVKGWLAGTRSMPLETRNYVYAITGYTVEEWAENNVKFVGLRARGRMSTTACKQLSMALRVKRPRLIYATLHDDINKASGYNRKNMKKARKKGHTRAAYRRTRQRRHIPRRVPRMPWGVQLAGSFSRAVAMKQYRVLKRKYGRILGKKRVALKSSRQGGRGRRVFHRVRVGAKSRQAAGTICKRLRAAGGNCVVMKN